MSGLVPAIVIKPRTYRFERLKNVAAATLPLVLAFTTVIAAAGERAAYASAAPLGSAVLSLVDSCSVTVAVASSSACTVEKLKSAVTAGLQSRKSTPTPVAVAVIAAAGSTVWPNAYIFPRSMPGIGYFSFLSALTAATAA